jgi:hypothetical protein
VFGLALEFRTEVISKTMVFATLLALNPRSI